jgi:hypothetical protein
MDEGQRITGHWRVITRSERTDGEALELQEKDTRAQGTKLGLETSTTFYI